MSNSIIDAFSKVLINDSYGKYSNMIDSPSYESLRTITIKGFHREFPWYLHANVDDYLMKTFCKFINFILQKYKVTYIDIIFRVEGVGMILISESINDMYRIKNIILKQDLEFRKVYENEFLPKYFQNKTEERKLEKEKNVSGYSNSTSK